MSTPSSMSILSSTVGLAAARLPTNENSRSIEPVETAFCACASIEMYSILSSVPCSSSGGGGSIPRASMIE